MAAVADRDLSLSAELLLFAIDPADGGLVPHDRGRFREALADSERSNGHKRRWGARRRALRELERAGLVEPRRQFLGRVRLADRDRAAAYVHRLRKCLRDDEFATPRDRELAIILAWAGVLTHRLGSRDERRIAARRIRKVAHSLEVDGLWQAPLSGTLAEPDWVNAVGRVAYDAQSDLLSGAIAGFASGDAACFNAVGLTGGGSESFAGSDGGGSDCR